jgi:NDP-sugar pyrophosphorylase family protein
VIPAVVMAAGVGSRLRPLTERWAKPVLPIDGRPVIATLLRELAAAGCPHVTVVTGHHAEQIERLVGDLGAFGVPVTFARQPSADGSADAVLRAHETAPYLVVGADTLFGPGDVGRFARAFAATGAAGALAVRRRRGEPGTTPVRVVDGLIERVPDDDPESPLVAAPLWAIGPELAPALEGLPGPPYELAAAFRRALDAGKPLAGIEIGPTRDLTSPQDLALENFPYLRDL